MLYATPYSYVDQFNQRPVLAEQINCYTEVRNRPSLLPFSMESWIWKKPNSNMPTADTTPLLFRKDNEPEFLNATGLLLGVMEDAQYSEELISLEPEDLLILFTDGITETMNSRDEQFELDRIIELIRKNRKRAPQQTLQTILEEIKKHAVKAAQSDDITIMIIKREES